MSSENKDLRNNVVNDDSDLEYIDINKEETAATPTADSRRTRTKVGTMLLLAITILAVIATCIACNSNKQSVSDDPVTPVGTSQPSVEDEKDDTGEVVVAPEVTEEPSKEESEVTEEPQGPQTVEEWVMSLDNSELIVGIWHEDQKQGEILDDHQEICISEGDAFIAVAKDLYQSSFSPDLIPDIDNIDLSHHFIFKITEEAEQSDQLYAYIAYEGNKEQSFLFYIVDEIQEPSENKEPENISDFADGEVDWDLCVLIADVDMNLVDDPLKDGDSYTSDLSRYLWLYLPKEASNITTTTEYVEIRGGTDYVKSVNLYFTDENVEIPITVEYVDGTTEKITIYITNEW